MLFFYKNGFGINPHEILFAINQRNQIKQIYIDNVSWLPEGSFLNSYYIEV